MLKFYYKKLSLYSRPVWIALLEKKLPFEPIELALNGDHWQPEFLAINPFGRVPVLVDDEFTIFESLSILNYLELQYPTPSLLPTDTKTLTIVQMIEMLALHELIPAMLTIIRAADNENALKESLLTKVAHGGNPQDRTFALLVAIAQAHRQITAMLDLIEKHLNNRLYIADDRLSYAEIVAGSLILWLPSLNITLSNYPQVESWSERLKQRPTWQATQPDPKIVPDWLRRIQKLPQVRQRQWRQTRKNY